jgi:lipopolysaccharide biosynthesis glycosyltransferase/predicted Zn-dependent protease
MDFFAFRKGLKSMAKSVNKKNTKAEKGNSIATKSIAKKENISDIVQTENENVIEKENISDMIQTESENVIEQENISDMIQAENENVTEKENISDIVQTESENIVEQENISIVNEKSIKETTQDKKSKVSVVVALTEYEIFSKYFNAVFGQTYKNIEFIIVNNIPEDEKSFLKKDDKKQDNDLKIRKLLKYYKKSDVKIVKYINKKFSFETPLRADLWQLGAKKATGDYIVFADEYTIWSRNFIAESVKKLESENTDFSTANLTIKWHDGGCVYYPQELIPSANIVSDFLNNANRLTVLRTVDNKVIKKSICNKVFEKISKFNKDYNLTYEINSEFLVAFLIFAASEKFSYIENEFSANLWRVKDERYIKYAKNSEPNDLISDFTNLYEYLTDNFKMLKFDDFFENLINYFNYRLNWTFKFDFANEISKKFIIPEFVEFKYSETVNNTEKVIPDVIDLFTPEIEEVELTDKKISVYVPMRKPAFVPENKYLKPIQSGADCDLLEVFDNPFDTDILKDNQGENISAKYHRYTDLTAQFWAFKNDTDSEYIGFFKDNSYLLFDEFSTENTLKNVEMLDEDTLKELKLGEKNILSLCSEYDVILPFESFLTWDNQPITALQRFNILYKEDDLQTLIKIISVKRPEYTFHLLETLNGNEQILTNQFVMKKELFNRYSALVFDVLAEVDSSVVSENFPVRKYASFDYLACILLQTFIKYETDKNEDLTVFKTSYTVVENTVPVAKVNKIDLTQKKKLIPICICCNNDYAKYVSVILQSIFENSNKDYLYDVVILSRDINVYNKHLILEQFAENDWFSVRFYDITRNFSNYTNLFADKHISLEVYYQILIPEVFADYEKVLYLDVDMIVNEDVAELFDTDLGEKFAGVVKDLDFNIRALREEPNQLDGMKELKLSDYSAYFNSGLILLNIPTIKEVFTVKDIMKVAMNRKFHDRDTLNYLFNGNVEFLDEKWNVLWSLAEDDTRTIFSDELPLNLYRKLKTILDKPGVIHYTSEIKPWHKKANELNNPFLRNWWNYAAKTPYYESLELGLLSDEIPLKSWFIFTTPKINENCGTPILKIKLLNKKSDTNIIKLGFIYLADSKEAFSNSLFINVGIDENNIPVVKNFDWQRDFRAFKYHIGYTINAQNELTIWARYINMYEGYSISVDSLISRQDEKPTVEIINSNYVDKLTLLPEGFKYDV